MSYRVNAGAAPRPMNPPVLSSRPAQPASVNNHSPTPSHAAAAAAAAAGAAGRSSPVLVRQPQPSSFESQPISQPRPAPQPPAAVSALPSSPAQGQAPAGPRPPPLTLEESKHVARTHHAALKRWLAQEGALNSASTRTNAREKLTRLTRQQFQELSTDVYDELVRRLQDSPDGPHGQQHGFLAVRPDFHPKRNQARQKLATLPITRFRDLGSDVYFELDRRYPEFNEEGEAVEPLRSPISGQGFQQQQQQPYRAEQAARGSPQLSRDGSLASSHSHSLSAAGQPQQQQSQQQYQSMRQGSPSPSPAPPLNLNAQRRAPTPTSTGTSSPVPTAASGLPPAVPLMPAGPLGGSVAMPTSNDVVVPNKSTMRVEEPPPRTAGAGGGGGAGGGAAGVSSPPPSATSSHFATGSISTPPPAAQPSGGPTSASLASAALARSGSSTSNEFSPQQQQQYSPSPVSRQLPSTNTALPTSSPQSAQQQQQQQQQPSPSQAASPGFAHRASEASSTGMMSRFVGGYGAGGSQYAASQAGMSEAGRGSWEQNRASSSEQIEQVRASYEYKLTMLQNRVAELENATQRAEQSPEHKEHLLVLEQQLDERERRIRALQEENSSLRSVQSTPAVSHTASGHSRADSQFRARLQEAEELASELRGEVSALVDEVRSANERADDLQAEVEREREERDKVEREATAWKERYQQVKVELRNIKATSQLFTSSISPDADFMPASADGLVSDTAVGTFQTSIDDLLQAARSKEPSNVFNAAHAVVRACEALDKDVQAIPPARLASFAPQEQDHIEALKGNINSTLSNLMTASKNHATSFGVLPVSLVDAAASHLAQAVVELVRVLKIRRTGTGSGPTTPQRNGFARNEPMPPLPEDAPAQIAQRSDSLKQRGQAQTQSPVGKAQGYFSGGLSTVKHALETIGLSSPTGSQDRELSSSRSVEERLAAAGEPQSGFSTSSAQSHQQSYGSHSTRSSSVTGALYSPPASQRQVDHSSSSTATSVSSPPPANQSDHQSGQVPPLPPRNVETPDWRHREQRSEPPSRAAQQDPYGPQGGHYARQYGYDSQQQPQSYGQQGMSPRAPYEAVPSPTTGGEERAPEELRAYVENQTELIVHSIQSLLSAIRSGASAAELNDSLNQIITIVSSIVAISQQALPATDAEADAVLQDLTTHCDKLSEMQSTAGGNAPTFTKQTKQAMAAASFGVAKSLKQLNGLLNGSANHHGGGGGGGGAGPDSLT